MINQMREIENKIEDGSRLNEADALYLFESPDLMRIGALADRVNRRKNQDRIFYNINRHINPTNICALSCKFCAFSRKPGEEGAYAYEIDEMVEKARTAVAQGATELHMVGGLHPRWPFKRYLDMIATMHAEFPGVHLKAFTAVELDWMARRERRSLAEILQDLKNAGLGSLPGGGAEIFHPEIRDEICDTKVSADQWIDTHRLAHSMGLRSNCTMLYGHIERFEHRVDHMRRLRELQDETGGFNVFIPLSFQPNQNDMGIGRYTFGFDDLKTLAVARLYLDNFANIKAYWVMLGQDIAQLGLSFGANDFDGTVTEEKISLMAGGRSGMAMSRTDLENLILRAGRTPVERDTLYKPINLEKSLAQVTQGNQSHQANRSQQANRNLPVSRARKMTFAITPHTVVLKLDEMKNLSWASLLTTCQSNSSTPSSNEPREVILAGMSVVANLMEKASVDLHAGMTALRAAGVRRLAESPSDARWNTHDKVHRAAHQADLPTTGRLTLRATADGCDWNDFRKQLDRVSDGLRPLGMTAISLGTSPYVGDSGDAHDALSMVVTATEYLHAVSQLRFAAGERATIITSLMDDVPTLAPAMGLGSDGSQHPAQKLVPLLADFGSDDLGLVDPALIKVQRLIEDIRSAGLAADVKFAPESSQTDAGLDLRHKPRDRA